MHVTESGRSAADTSTAAPSQMRGKDPRPVPDAIKRPPPTKKGSGESPSPGGPGSMNVGDAWRTLLRRWYLVLLVIALVYVAVLVTMARVGPSYVATGSVLVFPPSDDGEDAATPDNPYLALTGLVHARDIVVRTVNSKSTQDAFEERFPEASFEAVPDPTNSAPIVVFVVKAKDQGDAAQALDSLMVQVPETLRELQRDLPLRRSQLISSMPLTQDSEPELQRKAQVRAGIAVGAGALALGLLLIALIDGVLTRRRRRAGAKES